jgi:RNA polymerase-binding transcription factor DksA
MGNMTTDYAYFKEKLEKEKGELEAEMAKVGHKDPNNPSNWTASPADRDVSQADENTVADSIEEYEENSAILNTLEARYKDVKSGLDKIEKNVYGTCQICGKEIEFDRLDANPAARTCKEHMDLK